MKQKLSKKIDFSKVRVAIFNDLFHHVEQRYVLHPFYESVQDLIRFLPDDLVFSHIIELPFFDFVYGKH